jgi:hypothetical protein
MKVYVTSNAPVYSDRGERITWDGRYSRNIADSMHSLGHDVVLIAPAHSNAVAKELPYPVRPMLFSQGGQSYAHFDHNFPVFASHPLSTQTFLQMPKVAADRYLMGQSWIMSTSELLFGRPDVVISSGASTWNFVASAYPTAFVTHADNPLDPFHGSELAEVARAGLIRSSVAIASSEMASRHYRNLALQGIYPELTALIHGAIRTDQLQVGMGDVRASLLNRYPDVLHGVASSDFWVVHSCELAGVEGIEGLIRAAQDYDTYLGSRVSTIIIGLDKDTEIGLKRMVADMEIAGVRFISQLQDKADLGRFIGEAHVVTFPSGREAVGMLYADVANLKPLPFDGPLVEIEDVTAQVVMEDKGSIAALRWAKELATLNTELRKDLRAGLLKCLNHELRVALNLGGSEKVPKFSEEVLDLSRRYQRFAAQKIATDSILDGVVSGVNRFLPGEEPNNNRALDLASQYFGRDVFGRRIESVLLNLRGGGRSRAGGMRVGSDGVYRKARLSTVSPDTRVMREFGYLRQSVGTDQLPKAMRRFDRSVMTYLGTRATYSHQLNMGAIADPRVMANGIFAEVARAAGVELQVFNEVMTESLKVGVPEIMGREYEQPMRSREGVLRIDSLRAAKR